MNVIALALLFVTAAPERLDLTGRVTTTGGASVPSAHVMIYTARVRKGTSPFWPSCYADCSKRAKTAEDGTFTIASLDPDLLFRVLVVADGFKPAFAEKVDPRAKPLTFALTRFDTTGLDAKRMLRGIVVSPDGKPVAGAVVTPSEFKTEDWSGFKPGVFDPLAVTNDLGHFVLTARSPIQKAMLKVEARGLAPYAFANLRPQPEPHKLTMKAGVTVTGRLLRDGEPIAGASIGMIQIDRHNFLGPLDIGTDNEGKFTFLNVNPLEMYYIYGMMRSLKDQGAVPVKSVRLGEDGSTVNVGDLKLVPGHAIAGHVILSDGKPIPPHTRLLVSRESAWDSQLVELSADGKFVITSLPTERCSLSVALKGYRFSPKNHSIDSFNPRLIGMVDQDITNLKILMEPGGP